MASSRTAKTTRQHAQQMASGGANTPNPPEPPNFALVNRYLTPAAANYLGIRSETLARWRSERRALGIGQPHFYRIGKKVVYLKSDLDAFLLGRGEASLATLKAH